MTFSMQLKGTFEKTEVRVGLSDVVPLNYSGPSEKYLLSDLVTDSRGLHYIKQTLKFELYATSDELLVFTPERSTCYRLVSALPEAALPELQENLLELHDHYLSIASAKQHVQLLPPPQTVTPVITGTVKT